MISTPQSVPILENKCNICTRTCEIIISFMISILLILIGQKKVLFSWKQKVFFVSSSFRSGQCCSCFSSLLAFLSSSSFPNYKFGTWNGPREPAKQRKQVFKLSGVRGDTFITYCTKVSKRQVANKQTSHVIDMLTKII